jgi:hypothetical protein
MVIFHSYVSPFTGGEHRLQGGFFRPWGDLETKGSLATTPGSCLLVSAGNGVHLLDPETKSSLDKTYVSREHQ